MILEPTLAQKQLPTAPCVVTANQCIASSGPQMPRRSPLDCCFEGRRSPDFKLAAGEILFVINFSFGLRSRKLQTSCCFDGSLLKISFCSVSIRTDSDPSYSRAGLSGEITFPCLLTDPSVLHQTGFVPSPASRPWKEPPIKPLEPGKCEATLECLLRLGRMRGRPSPRRPAPWSQFSLLPPPGARGVRGASRRPPS